MAGFMCMSDVSVERREVRFVSDSTRWKRISGSNFEKEQLMFLQTSQLDEFSSSIALSEISPSSLLERFIELFPDVALPMVSWVLRLFSPLTRWALGRWFSVRMTIDCAFNLVTRCANAEYNGFSRSWWFTPAWDSAIRLDTAHNIHVGGKSLSKTCQVILMRW